MSRCLAALTAAVLASFMTTAQGQTPVAYTAPRTAEGHPDLQGVWMTAFVTSLERPPFVKSLTPSPDEAKALAAKYISFTPDVVDPDANFGTDFPLGAVKGVPRAYMLVEPADGQLPFSKTGLAAVKRYKGEGGYANPEERPMAERCIIGWGQAPIRPEHGATPTQIVQTPDAIVLMTEDVGGLRIVDMTGKAPPPAALRSYEGYSAGHWEGDTLVIVTTHLRADDPYREHFDRPIVVGPTSRVIERLTRVSDTELLEQFTVEDASLYASPWLAEFSHTRTDKTAYEYACHESNYSLTGILRAARMGLQDKPKKQAKPKKKL